MEEVAMRIRKHHLWIIILSFAGFVSQGQEVVNELQLRSSVEMDYKVFKGFHLSFSPEVRFDKNMSLENYHFQLEADYKLNKIWSIGARYRFVVNPRDAKETEYLSRYGLNLKIKKEFRRFNTGFRLSYTNDADEDYSEDRSHYLRYKASVKYNIKKCKLTPKMGLEAFQELSGDGFYKMRYIAGADYKLFKKNYLGVTYKFDYYRTAYLNKHIIELNYKIKF